MKIAMYNITTSIKIGGIETYYWEVSKELHSRGVNVEIISGQGSEIKYPELSLSQFPFKSRDRFANLGTRYKKFRERVSFFLSAKRYIKKTHFDVILVRKPFDFFVCYFMKKWHKNITTVFVSGGEDFYFFDTYFVKYVDVIFAVSNDNKQKLLHRYNRDVVVMHNGVDTQKFQYNPHSELALRTQYNLTDKHVLISVGRVIGWKGLSLIVDALLDGLDNYVYIVVGDGDYLPTLKNIVAEKQLEEQVIFLGALPNNNLPNVLSVADIFIQPSVGNEAFGITLVEALSCGLPVVASNNGGMVDIISHGYNGYLFEIGNSVELQHCIVQCINNKEKLSKHARDTVVSQFSWAHNVNILLSTINYELQ